jgi:hypothetical protein
LYALPKWEDFSSSEQCIESCVWIISDQRYVYRAQPLARHNVHQDTSFITDTTVFLAHATLSGKAVTIVAIVAREGRHPLPALRPVNPARNLPKA